MDRGRREGRTGEGGERGREESGEKREKEGEERRGDEGGGGEGKEERRGKGRGEERRVAETTKNGRKKKKLETHQIITLHHSQPSNVQQSKTTKAG